ncbi:MAG TPA: mycofactocin-coupled SDR family oxidoreductase [Acidimicrobiales bacterium]|nr:mycofactocin-coupled SDR family oxidoreductase [Acidimicrobiales bacterium]
MTTTRAAVVTGAARGIGAAVARGLAADGWKLVLVDACRDEPGLPYPLAAHDELDQVATDCDALAVVGDVRSQADLNEAVELARSSFGGLDAAVAAAGLIAGGRSGWETPDATWDMLIDVNLAGVWKLARAAVPAMLERPEPRTGRFVALSSVAGLTGMPLLAAYSASKHGVIGLVRSMAAELGPTGVTANVVAPGSTATAMLQASADIYGLAHQDEFSVHHPMGRLLNPDEVAAVVRWLLSPASSALTGAVLPADAGMSAAQ